MNQLEQTPAEYLMEIERIEKQNDRFFFSTVIAVALLVCIFVYCVTLKHTIAIQNGKIKNDSTAISSYKSALITKQ